MSISTTRTGWSAGCSLYIILFVGSFLCLGTFDKVRVWFYEQPEPERVSIFVWSNVGFIVLSLVLAFFATNRVQKREQRRRDRLRREEAERERAMEVLEHERQEKERIKKELMRATEGAQSLAKLQEVALGLEGSFQDLLDKAWDSLSRADQEWEERAFGPFWNEIEEATLALAQFSFNVDHLHSIGQDYLVGLSNFESYGDHYLGLLESRGYSFPRRIEISTPIPSPSTHLVKLGALTRKGQKDFEFALVGEHHLTRKVLVEGFTTVWKAITLLEVSAERSLKKLTETVSTSSERIAAGVKAASVRVADSVCHTNEEIRGEIEGVRHLLDERLSGQ